MTGSLGVFPDHTVAPLIVIHHTIWLMPFKKKETESIIKSLKPKNTCGYDKISTELLKIALLILPHL
jgi:hypothetical protein